MMTVKDRVNGHDCPYCAGRKVLKGYNDLQSQRPDLLEEWDWDENDKKRLKPDEITSYSHVKASWICMDYGHSYEMNVNDKANNAGCPYCSNRKVLIGFNDLQSNYSELIESEWDWIENNKHGLKPDAIVYGSKVKAYWKCSHGHNWKTSVFKRTVNGSKCPHCSHRISKQENEVAEFIRNYLCTHYDGMNYTMHRSIKFKRIYEMLGIDTETVLSDDLQSHLMKELDIYMPELNLAVEYDGDYWHDDKIMIETRGLTNSELHTIKQLLCKQAGIKLLFITEHDWVHDNNIVNKIIDELFFGYGKKQ